LTQTIHNYNFRPEISLPKHPLFTMRFSTAIISLAAGASFATATANERSQQAFQELNEVAEVSMQELSASGCDILGMQAALLVPLSSEPNDF
jgi:hypothetical protein